MSNYSGGDTISGWTPKLIEAKEIVSFEIAQDGKGLVSSSSGKNVIGSAAIGGTLYGGAGAVVGAIAGSKENAKITDLSLVINVNDIESPYVSFGFLSSPTENGSEMHKNALGEASKWYGILNIMLTRVQQSAKEE